MVDAETPTVGLIKIGEGRNFQNKKDIAQPPRNNKKTKKKTCKGEEKEELCWVKTSKEDVESPPWNKRNLQTWEAPQGQGKTWRRRLSRGKGGGEGLGPKESESSKTRSKKRQQHRMGGGERAVRGTLFGGMQKD